MKERVVVFGQEGNLTGIVCEPDAPTSKPWVVMSNVGLNHRVGPRRLWVELARMLAADGVCSLRFDSSGLGDSEQRREALGDRARVTRDAQEAVTFVQSQQANARVQMVGLCSGTDAVYDLARDDARVTGAFFIDGYAYRAGMYKYHHYRRRLFTPHYWRHFVARRLKGGEVGGGEAAGGVFRREYPSQPEFKAAIAGMLAQGKRLGFVYTGGASGSFNHAEQFSLFAGTSKGVDVWFRPEADHLFTRITQRRWLLDVLRGWLR